MNAIKHGRGRRDIPLIHPQPVFRKFSGFDEKTAADHFRPAVRMLDGDLKRILPFFLIQIDPYQGDEFIGIDSRCKRKLPFKHPDEGRLITLGIL